jgi:predicted DnaQ family exonuclease/DinG family helicase
MSSINDFYTFIAFDIETTGLTDTDKIIEFGAARFEKSEVKETMQLTVNPNITVPPEVLQLTGINNEEIKKSPFIEELRDNIINFLGDSPVIAHNAPFDVSFIKREVFAIDNPIIDTLVLSRILLPFIQNHKLETLYYFFEEEESVFHRALDDAIATGKVFLHLKSLSHMLHHSSLEKILLIAESMEDDSINLFKSTFKKSLKKRKKDYHSYQNEHFNIPDNVFQYKSQKEKSISPPTIKQLKKIFQKKKTFTSIVGRFEQRKEQIDLSENILTSFLQDEILVAEAGTGTGKTFAYLVPSILWSKCFNEKTLISTYTKNLQDQLFYKDIANISRVLDVDFKATLAKGRNNYICLKHWREILAGGFSALNLRERQSLLYLILWQELTNTGDISENSSFWMQNDYSLWSRLSCDTLDCNMTECPYSDKCYLTKVRRNARDSNILVINHSLLLSDMNAEQRILGKYTRLIIDEAHNFERAATDFLGINISSWQVNNVLDRFSKRGKGVLIKIRDTLTFLGKEKPVLTMNEIKESIKLVEHSKGLFDEIFEKVKQYVKTSEYSGKLRLKQSHGCVREVESLNEELFSNMKNVNNTVSRFIKMLEMNDDIQTGKEILEEVKYLHNECEETFTNLHNILSCEEKNNCYWVEQSGDENGSVKFISAPIAVGDILKNELFTNLETAILLSATILVDNKFDYFLNKMGLSGIGRVNKFSTGTPFDFDNQVFSIIPYYISEPQKKNFFIDIVDIVRNIVLATRKGTLVLFTSYKLLNEVYERLVRILNQNNISLLAQGRTGSRSVITKEFKQIDDSVLFGTYSFWEGLDVPGKALEILVITKIPFPVPKEPIIEARAEYFASMGLNPFSEFYIPEAIIKLRQGFGRLIRNKEDKGIIVILDKRLIKRDYGTKFLNSLPANVEIAYGQDQFLKEIQKFWEIS